MIRKWETLLKTWKKNWHVDSNVSYLAETRTSKQTSTSMKNHVKYHLHILAKPTFGIGLISSHAKQWKHRLCKDEKSRKRLSGRVIRVKRCQYSLTQWDSSCSCFICLMCFLSGCWTGNANHRPALTLFYGRNSSRCHQLLIPSRKTYNCFGNDLVKKSIDLLISDTEGKGKKISSQLISPYKCKMHVKYLVTLQLFGGGTDLLTEWHVWDRWRFHSIQSFSGISSPSLFRPMKEIENLSRIQSIILRNVAAYQTGSKGERSRTWFHFLTTQPRLVSRANDTSTPTWSAPQRIWVTQVAGEREKSAKAEKNGLR